VLASGQLTPVSTITIELHEDRDDVPVAVREPAAVLIHWPEKHCMIHPSRFGEVAATAARLFATAATELAGIKAQRRVL
jgi:hypothetical protein